MPSGQAAAGPGSRRRRRERRLEAVRLLEGGCRVDSAGSIAPSSTIRPTWWGTGRRTSRRGTCRTTPRSSRASAPRARPAGCPCPWPPRRSTCGGPGRRCGARQAWPNARIRRRSWSTSAAVSGTGSVPSSASVLRVSDALQRGALPDAARVDADDVEVAGERLPNAERPAAANWTAEPPGPPGSTTSGPIRLRALARRHPEHGEPDGPPVGRRSRAAPSARALVGAAAQSSPASAGRSAPGGSVRRHRRGRRSVAAARAGAARRRRWAVVAA